MEEMFLWLAWCVLISTVAGTVVRSARGPPLGRVAMANEELACRAESLARLMRDPHPGLLMWRRQLVREILNIALFSGIGPVINETAQALMSNGWGEDVPNEEPPSKGEKPLFTEEAK